MLIKGEGDLEPIYPFPDIKKSSEFNVKSFDRNYLKILQILPEEEELLYAMPAMDNIWPLQSSSGAIALTKERLVYCGGSATASFLDLHSFFERSYADIKYFSVIQNEKQLNQFSLIIGRTDEYNPMSLVKQDSFGFAANLGHDLLKFANNAAILCKRFKK